MKYTSNILLIYALSLFCSPFASITSFVLPQLPGNICKKIGTLKTAFDSNNLNIATRTGTLTQTKSDAFTNEKISSLNGRTIKVPFSFSTPAEYESTKFKLDETVTFWKDININGTYTEKDYRKLITDVISRFLSSGNGDASSYIFRHGARSGYFLVNAVLGTLASESVEQIRSFVSSGVNNGVSAESGFLKNMANTLVISRLLSEVALTYEQDYTNIKRGLYKKPFDMYTTQSIHQRNPAYIGQQTMLFISEAVATWQRQKRATEEDKNVSFFNLENAASIQYPDYYKTAFHYQTNGWLSEESANVYETSTETLFLGRQDACSVLR